MTMAMRALFLCIFTYFLFSVAYASKHRELRNVPSLNCIAYDGTPSAKLQAAIDYVCSKGVNCGIIKPGGPCFNPNTLVYHASAVLSAYYKAHGAQGFYCTDDGPLKGVGILTFTDPFEGSCKSN